MAPTPIPPPTLDLPPDALVLLVGAAGSGKSTLAARFFTPPEILSSDDFRATVSGDAADQSATDRAFELLHAELARRMAAGALTVVDATNVQGWARRRLLEVARRHDRPTVALVLALPLEVSLARNTTRLSRRVPPSAVRRQDRFLRASLPRLAAEGYTSVLVLTDAREADQLELRRVGIRTQRNVPKERHPAL